MQGCAVVGQGYQKKSETVIEIGMIWNDYVNRESVIYTVERNLAAINN